MQFDSAPTQDMIGEGAALDAAYLRPSQIRDRSPSQSSRPWQARAAALRAEQLATAHRLRDQQVAVISHELRNSLSAVRNGARLLDAQLTEHSLVANARSLIDRQVGQMARLVEELLEVSRTGKGRVRLQCERVDLCLLVQQAVECIEGDIGEHGHRLAVILPTEPLWLDADPGRLGQVFANLLINAVKYTDDGGDISLTVERVGDQASVRVRDSGIGIAASLLPRIFGLFIQAAPAAARSEDGLGIGLAVVRSLVEMHGGRVSVSSDGIGHGSEFTVLLPVFVQ